ncbi:MAG: hypothetical protein D6758_05355 [Gammaproteobacteria bacterium]|nr:MAG: hypothetical protein D6758_05355 [Gammaproteobacteria bacterium]
MIKKQQYAVQYAAKRAYVTTMMEVVGRALAALTREDPVARETIERLPEGFRFAMTVMPDGPGLMLRKNAQGVFVYEGAPRPGQKAELTILIKHIEHAFRMLTFQESTAQAFANDRMLVDGEIGYAVRLVRALNRLESIILPKLIAERAVKEVDDLPLTEKIQAATRVYGGVLKSLVDTGIKELSRQVRAA